MGKIKMEQTQRMLWLSTKRSRLEQLECHVYRAPKSTRLWSIFLIASNKMNLTYKNDKHQLFRVVGCNSDEEAQASRML